MIDAAECQHASATIKFVRSGTRLHPKVWMEERCVDCDSELDRKTLTRGVDGASRRKDNE